MKKALSVLLSFVMVLFLVPSVFAKDTNAQTYSVLFEGNNIPADFEKQIHNLGGEIVYRVPEIGFVQVSMEPNSASILNSLSGVSAANPSLSWSLPDSNRIEADVTASDIDTSNADLWEKQWDIKRITENGASYELGTGSHDVVVGIIDTGIDRDHPDLVGNLQTGSKNFVPAGGFQGTEPYETGDSNAFDDIHGHGSHVAGSIAGNGAMLGVAPDTGIRAYRVFGKSSAESAWIYKAMIAAADDGVDVISMSLGGFDILGQIFEVDPISGKKENIGNDVADFKAYKRAVQYVREKGALVVAAAGNDAINATKKAEVTEFLNNEYGGDGLYFKGAGFEVPGVIPGVVTVSATGPNDQFASYSNYGPGFIDITTSGGDYRQYVQALSEGWFEDYLDQRLFENEFNLSASEDGGWYWSIGTSMATPKVSAVAALLVDKYGKMSPKQLENLLYNKAVDPVKGKNKSYFGAGHLNAVNALK